MTNEAKPSEVAMRILASLGTCTCTPQPPDGDRKCDCPGCIYLQYQYDANIERRLTLAITSAIADAVRKEAEECAKVAERYWNVTPNASNQGLADTLRARHTTDSKEQPR